MHWSTVSSEAWKFVVLQICARPDFSEEDSNLINRDGNIDAVPASNLDQQLMNNYSTRVLKKKQKNNRKSITNCPFGTS